MITSEQDLVVKKYNKPTTKKSVESQMFFRGQVEDSRKLLTPILHHSNCISFDQSYFTRTIGQLQIQERLEGDYSLYSGAGFGTIQAFWGALGRDTKDLAKKEYTKEEKARIANYYKRAEKKPIKFKTRESSIAIATS